MNVLNTKNLSNKIIYIKNQRFNLFFLVSLNLIPQTHANFNIENISFNFFIDINIYLDSIYGKCKFSDVPQQNFGIPGELTLECNVCKAENTIKSQTYFIKLSDILIFTLERNLGNPNKVPIIPNNTINMGQYLDKNLKIDSAEYELFAINIRLGSTINFGHEICQLKRNQIWYEISDTIGKKLGTELPNDYYYDSSCGLFYKKLKNEFNIKFAY